MFRRINTSTSDLNEDLDKIGKWAWKINFIIHLNKQAEEVIFSMEKATSLDPFVHSDKHVATMNWFNLGHEHQIKSILNRDNKGR